ncbi:MAG: inositol monophosphatase family protein [bacterium]|nr:inositol monophosphatase family protein [bacterium]
MLFEKEKHMRSYGVLTGPAIGFILKEAVRRAITVIRAQRLIFDAQVKLNEYKPEKDDFVTSADRAAQEVYVRVFREAFPDFGIIAEEDHLHVEPTGPEKFYLTVDPLDGTKAYVRRQSHGIGTMVSLVHEGEVITAYIGDVLTGEVYGYRPESDKVHRITDVGAVHLEIDRGRTLSDQFVLLRDETYRFSPRIQAMVAPHETSVNRGGLFKGYEVTGGSIGISMARLWKGEVGAAVLRPGANTPWDLDPVLGISRKLGFMFLQIDSNRPITGSLRPVTHVIESLAETVIIHESRYEELHNWLSRQH